MTSDREPRAEVVHPRFAQETPPPPPTRIGGWSVDAGANSLDRGGTSIRLEPRVMALLLALASQPGRTFTRVELIDSVWSDVVVNDDALSTAVSKLRRVFEDTPDVAIETIPRVGYRLLATTSFDPASNAPTTHGDSTRFRPALAGLVIVLITIAIAVSFVVQLKPDVDRRQTESEQTAVPITSTPGMEVDPAPAPGPSDRRVAVAWKGPDQSSWDIWLTLGDGSPPARLTTSPAVEVRPAWSPDGSRIAFVRIVDGRASIHSVTSLGSEERFIASVEAGSTFDLDWSPDGETLIFPDRASAGEPWGIVAIELTSGARRVLTRPERGIGDIAAAWSPDGRTIAVVRSPVLGVEDIWLQPLDGEPSALTTDGRKIHGVDWTVDGDAVVFASNRGGAFALWSARAEDGAVRPVSGAGLGADGPRVGGDGSIAFVQWSDQADLSRLDLASGDRREHVSSTRYDWSPAWSVDGGLAFVSDRSGTPEIWTLDPDSAHPVRETRFNGTLVASPGWSPDGRTIAFDARPDGHADVFVLTPGSGVRHRIAPSPFDELNASWSEGGESIVFASNRTGRWEIWRAHSDGSRPVQLTDGGGYRAIEHAGILYVSRADESGLWRHRPEGTERVLDDLHPIDAGNWTIDGGSIWYVQRPTPYTPLLARFDLDTQTTTVVAEIDSMLDHGGLAIEPGGRAAWLSRIVRREADILVSRN